ncbi:two-component system response regulator [Phormidium willei BDU 130791]|nr:two-component system response regulator [Phormidium willei BDU 130791]
MTKTVLIAEDEPFIVESLTFLLTKAGYRVASYGEGQAALSAIVEQRPDLVLLDVMLPGINGFDLLRQLRATPGVSDMPVLALTAKGQDADRLRMLELGANDFVTKPFSNKDLMTRIGQLIDGEATDGASAGTSRNG